MSASPVASLIDEFIRAAPPPKSKSVGNYIGPIGKLGNRCWEAKESLRLLFYDQIRPGIVQHLDGQFRSVSTRDTINVTLYMVGRRANTAAPTVLFVSENESNRKKARKLIKESGILRQHSGWKTAEASKDPGWGARLEQLASGPGLSKMDGVSGPATQVLYDPSQPIQPQGTTLYVLHEAGLRVMTANLLWNDGKAFFLGPAHAFFESGENNRSGSDASDDDDFEIDSDDETATILAGGAAHDPPAIELDYDDSDDSDIWSSSDDSGDSETFSAGEGDSEVFSQSSLGSVEVLHVMDATPHGLEVSTPIHTTRAKFRTPAPGLYRPPADDLVPFGVLSHWSIDKDWALVEVLSDSDSSLAAFLATAQEDLATKPVASRSSAGAAIVTHTASSGEVTGVMSGTPSDICLPRGACFQEVYSVRLDAFLADGDCGSAVFDAITGELYGHIVAGCRASGFAYVMAASHVMPDVCETIASANAYLSTSIIAPVPYDQGTVLSRVVARLYTRLETPDYLPLISYFPWEGYTNKSWHAGAFYEWRPSELDEHQTVHSPGLELVQPYYFPKPIDYLSDTEASAIGLGDDSVPLHTIPDEASPFFPMYREEVHQPPSVYLPLNWSSERWRPSDNSQQTLVGVQRRRHPSTNPAPDKHCSPPFQACHDVTADNLARLQLEHNPPPFCTQPTILQQEDGSNQRDDWGCCSCDTTFAGERKRVGCNRRNAQGCTQPTVLQQEDGSNQRDDWCCCSCDTASAGERSRVDRSGRNALGEPASCSGCRRS